MKWIETKERLPDKDGLYLIEHKQHNQSGSRHEMFFKTDDKKWYWQPNPYSVCGDGFIVKWLDESAPVDEDGLWEEAFELIYGGTPIRHAYPDNISFLKSKYSITRK